MKRYLSILLITISMLFIVVKSKAQTPIIDSLRKISLHVSKDSAARLYVKIANIFTGISADSVRKYATLAGQMSPKNMITQGDVMVQFGNSYHMENKMDSALKYFNKALIHFTKAGNEKGVGKVYQSFAVVKKSLSDYEGSISDSKKALEIYEKIKWDLGIVNVENNISNSYSSLRKYREALNYSKRAFELSKTLNDSLKYFNMMMQLGIRFNDISIPDSALMYLLPTNSYFERNGLYGLLLVLNSNIANAYWAKNKNTTQTKNYLYKSLYYIQISGITDNLDKLYKDMTACYILENKRDSAEFYFYKTLGVIDSLNSQRALEQTKELQAKYETEKKDLQIKQQTSDLQLKASESKRKSIIIWLGLAALIGTGFFGAMAFINFKKAKKANIIIENQKLEVELKNKEITQQKELVDEKQKEIIDSINYAKRIQSAVLTGEEVWNKISKEHFILFKPKDIVSGDFYWAYNTPNNRSVFVLADCTGHGVPGGFMSMLGNSFLNEIVVENKLFKADEILNKLRNKIINALEQKGGTQQKDGMDMALCVWNKIDNTMEFAGANNPLWILREEKMTEYKASKMPIGAYTENLEPFTSVTIQLQKGDIIYMITDGYADQFGGPKGKKFKYKPLQEILIQNKNVSMSEQKIVLENALNQWKENYEQVDDISLIGVRV